MEIPTYWHEIQVNKVFKMYNTQQYTLTTLHRYAKCLTLKNKPLIHFFKFFFRKIN